MDNQMQSGSRDMRKPKSNVVAMKLDAAWFYERGVQFLQKNDLKKALRAFQRTVEFEPHNPINHCNLAGVLSEMGDFQASNEILMHILNDLDPNMAECQFYLANNYANMGQYDVAEEYVIKYLDADPDGEYAEDAEEMLDVLVDEFGCGKAYEKWEQSKQEQESALAKRDGRHLLEQGQFEAAVEWLESIVANEPDNTAAHNNLSLAYYYTGSHLKAIEMAESVLARQPDNIHALCNLAVFVKQAGSRDKLHQCVRKLIKVFPLHYDLAMKVGTTLGLVGHHLDAMHLFEQLARIVDGPEPVLIHSIAASAANAGKFSVAQKWWKQLTGQPEIKDIALYYLEQLERAVREGRRNMRVSYQYDLPLQVQFAEMKKRLHNTDMETWRTDPLLRASLYWGLRHGSADTRKAVIRTLALIADSDAEKALRAFLKRADVDEMLQTAALLALKKMNANGTVEVSKNGIMQQVAMSSLQADLVLTIDPAWQEVWRETETWLRKHHQAKLVKSARQMWLTYTEHLFFAANNRLGKPQIWMSGIVYLTLRYHGVPVLQKDIAEEFHVSPSSIRKASTRLEAVMFRNQEM
jgi:tetratricopeptide (TPR) repeat protein